MSVMLALRNVSTMMLIIANNAHKPVAGALKNVDGWQAKHKHPPPPSFFAVDGGFSSPVR
jgi:hypothetical protein